MDFDKVGFVNPFFLLPLQVYLKNCKKKITVKNESSYICTACFFNREVFPEKIQEGLEEFFMPYRNKSYIPITSFPNDVSQIDFKNKILEAAENLIVSRLRITPNILSGIKYLISESIDNISEHSESERGYIFMQYYRNQHYLDVCIADSGITILGSYKKLKTNNIKTDAEALIAAQNGLSSKNLPNAENRGYGISTSREMLVKGLEGHYFILSGNAFYIYSTIGYNYAQLPQKMRWQGTIVALRIPYNENPEFSILKYVEGV